MNSPTPDNGGEGLVIKKNQCLSIRRDSQGTSKSILVSSDNIKLLMCNCSWN